MLLSNTSLWNQSATLLTRVSFWMKLKRNLFTATSSVLLMSSSRSFSLLSHKQPVESSALLLESVYGPVNDEKFPLPMPADEAGFCADGYQRRYLWTDAFGVLAYTSLADYYQEHNIPTQSQAYRQAADTLIATVHQTLGRARSQHADDQMQEDPQSPTGYVGLRIGKVSSRKVTDYGMRYDGMYWHYIDKWLLALSRAPGHATQGIRLAKSVFPYFFDKGHGIRWKLSVDATPPPPLQHVREPNDDTLVALIVFQMLQHTADKENLDDNLHDEIKMLRQALQHYQPRVTDDPLAWGLEAMFDQFVAGQPRTKALASLSSSALDAHHLSLPFRLYGALIGARIAGSRVAPPEQVDRLIELSLDHEAKAQARGYSEHSSINRVMLAMCLLCPGGALDRRPDDPLIRL